MPSIILTYFFRYQSKAQLNPMIQPILILTSLKLMEALLAQWDVEVGCVVEEVVVAEEEEVEDITMEEWAEVIFSLFRGYHYFSRLCRFWSRSRWPSSRTSSNGHGWWLYAGASDYNSGLFFDSI